MQKKIIDACKQLIIISRPTNDEQVDIGEYASAWRSSCGYRGIL